jgi:two-component system copper resistance phosphate regulon response regulator CusR
MGRLESCRALGIAAGLQSDATIRGITVRLLLVEDEREAAAMLSKGLREQGFAVDVAPDGPGASFRLATNDYDLVILDVMLPGIDGLRVCSDLRAAGISIPVLMLTARDAVDARIAGLDSGADDYLTKPFDFGELLARLRALIRRGARPPVPDVLRAGPLVLDTRARTVTRDGELVHLTTREYALLEYLARRAGEFLGRAEIAEHVWDAGYDPLSNVVDVYVARLRRKIDTPDEASLIETRRGEGYALVDRPKA